MKTHERFGAKIHKTEEEWKKELGPEAYRVMREKGTEVPFSGAYWDHKEEGKYFCRACGGELFSSDTKFDSGSGWPSFTNPVNREHVELVPDRSHGVERVEVICKRCGAHLGHVFDDGPGPTGKRYCVNSICLVFEPKNKK